MKNQNEAGEVLQYTQESATNFINSLRNGGETEMANIFSGHHNQQSQISLHNASQTLNQQTQKENAKSGSLNETQKTQLGQLQQSRLNSAQSKIDAYRGYSSATTASMTVINRKDDPEKPIGKIQRKFQEGRAQFRAQNPNIAKAADKLRESSANRQARKEAAAEQKEEEKKDRLEKEAAAASAAIATQEALANEESRLLEKEKEESEASGHDFDEPEEKIAAVETDDKVEGEKVESDEADDNPIKNFSDEQSIQTEHGTVRKKGNTLSSNSPKALMSTVAARGTEKFTITSGPADKAVQCMEEGLNYGVPVVELSPEMKAKIQKDPKLASAGDNIEKIQNARKEAYKEKKLTSLENSSDTLQSDSMVKLSDPASNHYNLTAAAYLNNHRSFHDEDRREAINVLYEKYENGDITEKQFSDAVTPMMNKMDKDKKEEFRNKNGGENNFAKAEAKVAAPTQTETKTLQGTSAGLTANPEPRPEQSNTAQNAAPQAQDATTLYHTAPNADALTTVNTTANAPDAKEVNASTSAPAPNPATTTAANTNESRPRANREASTSPPVPAQSWTRESNQDILQAKKPGEALAEKASTQPISDSQMHNLKEARPEQFTETVATALSTQQPVPQNEKEKVQQQQREAQLKENIPSMLANLDNSEMNSVIEEVHHKGLDSIENDGDAKAEKAALQEIQDYCQEEVNSGNSNRPTAPNDSKNKSNQSSAPKTDKKQKNDASTDAGNTKVNLSKSSTDGVSEAIGAPVPEPEVLAQVAKEAVAGLEKAYEDAQVAVHGKNDDNQRKVAPMPR